MLKQRRQYGISIISCLPWVYNPKGLNTATRMAREARIDGIQALPLITLSNADIATVHKAGILSWEGAWNTGKLHEFFGGTMRMVYETALRQHCPWPWWKGNPNIIDLILFGTVGQVQRRERFMNSHLQRTIHVAHDPKDTNRPLEVHAEAKLSVEDYAKHPGGVVFDLRHAVNTVSKMALFLGL